MKELIDNIKIEEYKSLRDSIHVHMKLIPQVFILMVTVTCVILGYGISSKNPIVFLIPMLIIIPCGYFILSQMNEIMRKGAYLMKSYDESFKGWEYTLFKIREEGKKSLCSMATLDAVAFVAVMDSLLLICFFGYLKSSGDLEMIVKYISLKMFVWLFIMLVAILAIFISNKILKAYTFEKEKECYDSFEKKE
jgi:hypothetical protein